MDMSRSALSLHQRLHVRLFPEKPLLSSVVGTRFKSGAKWEVDRIIPFKQKVVVLLFNLEEEKAVLLEDDKGLFPSDTLVVKIRTLD